MKIFVTGATGFVGSRLVRALMERGDTVTCLVRSRSKAERLFGKQMPQIVEGDLWAQSQIKEGCRDVDVVYHSAALTTAINRREFFSINVDATSRVLDAVQEVAPNLSRFVYMSSLAAAGPSSSGKPRYEDDPHRPVSNYGESKLGGEKEVRGSGVPWTIMRPSAVYGPGDAAFLKTFKIARWGVFPVMGRASQELSMIHVDDLVPALLTATNDNTRNQEYFVCHPEIVTSGELARKIGIAVKRPQEKTGMRIVEIPGWASLAILNVTGAAARLVGKSTFLSRDKGNEFLAEAWTCSPAKLEQATDWRADITLQVGLPATAEWYRSHNWL